MKQLFKSVVATVALCSMLVVPAMAAGSEEKFEITGKSTNVVDEPAVAEGTITVIVPAPSEGIYYLALAIPKDGVVNAESIAYIDQQNPVNGKVTFVVYPDEAKLAADTDYVVRVYTNSTSGEEDTKYEVYFKYTGESITLGDVNDDGEIDFRDALLILRIAAGLVENPTDQQKKSSKVTKHDGDPDFRDALAVLRKAAGLIEEFDV